MSGKQSKWGARAILNELDRFQRRDYDSLVGALHNRFGSLHRSEIFRAKLQTRGRRDNESLSALSQDIKKLTRCAYPGAPSSVTDILALDQFIDALPDPDMRLRIREARPKNINDAEILAVRFETFKQADRHRSNNLVGAGDAKTVLPIGTNKQDKTANHESGEIKEMIGDLRTDLANLTQELKQSRNQSSGNKNFYNQEKQTQQNRPYSHNNPNRGNNWVNKRNNQRYNKNNHYQSSNYDKGNEQQSTSWARARLSQNGPSQ